MTVVRELIVTLGFDVDENKLKNLEQSLGNLKNLLIGVAGVAAGAGAALYGLTKYAADSAAQIKNTADSMGISYENFQKFSYAASLSGVKSEEFAASLRALNNAISGAKYGAADMIMTFARTNVRYLDSAGGARKLEDVMTDLSDSFAKMKDGPEKTAFAMKLFGEAGTRLLPTFAKGSAGLREMGAEIESFGGVLSDQEVELGNVMKQEFLRVQAIVMSIVRAVGISIMPVMSKAIQSFKAWTAVNKEIIKQKLAEAMEFLGEVLYWIWRTLVGVKDVVVLITRGVSYLNEKLGFLKYLMAGIVPLFGLFYLGKLVQGVYAVANAFLTMGRAAFLANLKVAAIPVLIGALVAAAFLILEDFVAFIDGRPSVLGFLIKNWESVMSKFQKAMDAAEGYVKNFVEKSTSAILQFFGVSKSAADDAGRRVGDAFTAATTRVKSAIDIWVGALAEVYPIVKRIAGGLADIFADALGGKKSGPEMMAKLFDKIVVAAKLAAEEIKRAFSYGVFDYLESRFSNLIKMMATIFGTLFPHYKFAVDNMNTLKGVATNVVKSAGEKIVETSKAFDAPFVPGAMTPLMSGTESGGTTPSIVFNMIEKARAISDTPVFSRSDGFDKVASGAPSQTVVNQTATVTAHITVPPGTTAKEAEGYVANGFGKAWEAVRYHTGAALTSPIQY